MSFNRNFSKNVPASLTTGDDCSQRFSVVETAKANGLDVMKYLNLIFRQIPMAMATCPTLCWTGLQMKNYLFP